GYEARTIHRMLELNGASLEDGGTASFQRNQENPLEADVVIIDEMSMVDVFLFQALLKAIAPGTRLILVGDMNQLPSVGPGEVLHDLIASETFETVILTKIFRQAEESDIVMNAHRIHRGEQIPLNNQSKDFFFLPRENPEQIYLQMVQMIRERLPKYVHAPSSDIQILTPMRKGPFGVEQLNKVLQQHLNPPQAQKKEHAIGEEKLFRVGDKVMQIRNNYQLEWEIVSKYGIPIDQGVGIFNGDMGTVVEINDHVQEVVVEFDEKRRVTYPFVQLDELELAYAITVHKSQGSEYPAVLMPLVAGPRQLFNRNLLYTAITRARNCVVILGVAETVQEMIRNERESQRYSSLDQRIREIAAAQEL
nr:AAA family ATPase [Lachnospiraceae bacterium]